MTKFLHFTRLGQIPPVAFNATLQHVGALREKRAKASKAKDAERLAAKQKAARAYATKGPYARGGRKKGPQ